MKNGLRFELLEYSIHDNELFVFEYNPKNKVGIFSISNLDNEKLVRLVTDHNVSKEEFASEIEELTKQYQKINI